MDKKENNGDEDFSLKSFFVPLTTVKAIHILVIVGFAAFFNGLLGSFLWDDLTQVVHNPVIHSLANIPAFFTGGTFFDYADGGKLTNIYYRPVATSVIAILYTLFGGTTFFYHATQLLLHIVNSVLIFLFFGKFIKKQIAIILSLVFLVHPIQVESVVWISAMQVPLSLLFGMIALLLVQNKTQTNNNVILTIVLISFSLLSKETGLLFFALVILYKLLFNRQNLKLYLLLSALSLTLYSILRLLIAKVPIGTIIPEIPIMSAPLSDRLLTIPAIVVYYLQSFFFPSQQVIGQMWVVRSPSFTDFYLPLIITVVFISLATMFGVLLLKKHQWREYSFFFVWFLLGMALHLQIFPLDFTVADRWFYFPMIGLLGMLGLIIQSFLWNQRLKTSFIVTALIVLVLLSFRTINRNNDWQNGLTLFSHDIYYVKDNAFMESSLATELDQVKRYDEAIVHYQKGYDLNHNNLINIFNIGRTYAKKGNFDNAVLYYQKFLSVKELDIAYEYWGKALIKSSSSATESAKLLAGAVSKYPNNRLLLIFSSIAEYESGNKQVALEQLNKARVIGKDGDSEYLYSRMQDNLPLDLGL